MDTTEKHEIELSVAASPTTAQQWLTALVLAVATVALIALFWDSAAAAVRTWSRSATFNHGFMIAPICAYLIWSRRGQIVENMSGPFLWGFPLLALACLAWLLGEIAGVLLVQQFALIAMFQSLCLIVLGWRVARVLAFPLFYLYFAVPFGEFLVEPLQNITAIFVVRALQLTGLPVYLDGIYISIPTGNFEVAEACAGVRFLISTIALGALVANLFYRSVWRRLALIGFAIAIPIIANGIRAYGIVMIAHLSDHKIAVGVDHIVYGWVFFAFVTVLLLLVGSLFREDFDSALAGRLAPGPIGTAFRSRSAFTILAAGLCAVLVAASAPAFAAYTEGRLAGRTIAEFPGPEITLSEVDDADFASDWKPTFKGADAELLRRYRIGRRTADIYIAYYAYQREGAEVVNSQNEFSGERQWTRVGGGRTNAAPNGERIETATMRLIWRPRGRIVWYWYWVDGRFTANPLFAKLLQVRARLFGGREEAAVVAVAADYLDNPEDATALLHGFLENLGPIGPLLEKAGERVTRQRKSPSAGAAGASD